MIKVWNTHAVTSWCYYIRQNLYHLLSRSVYNYNLYQLCTCLIANIAKSVNAQIYLISVVTTESVTVLIIILSSEVSINFLRGSLWITHAANHGP